MIRLCHVILFCLILTTPFTSLYSAVNLIEDPSCELTQPPNQFGMPFVKWTGWKYEGEAEFAIGKVAHSGKSSCLLIGKSSPKIRVWQEPELNPGRYRVTAYIRGLDISTGVWNQTTEFMFDRKYIQLDKNGTFGWTKLVYVGDVTEKKKVPVSFGLMATGFFWIGDVTLEEVGKDVPLTEKPILGVEEAPISPPGPLGEGFVRCPLCTYKNMPDWHNCYACGTHLEVKHSEIPKPLIKLIPLFDSKAPFYGTTPASESFLSEQKALRITDSYASLDSLQDWSGYDFLNITLYSDTKEPYNLTIEIRDTATRDYWTRVNYNTVAPPGRSTLVLPVRQLYVGEKSRPGRMINLNSINKFVLGHDPKMKSPIYIEKVWLERDELAQKVQFDGLYAFDFGTGNSPVMEGFTQIAPSDLYSQGRGYGLKDAKGVRAFNALQPDPLYQDYICIESGGFALDLPNGRYRVFLNVDNPSDYWGDYQIYRERTIFAQEKPVIHESLDFKTLNEKYYRHWNTEDLPTDNIFDKYQKTYYQEKTFDVDVTNGQLKLDFKGEYCANSVSTIIVYPISKADKGAQFLKWVEDKRRFYFDNYFKRTLHTATGDPVSPTAVEQKQGFIIFNRDIMQDLYSNDTPFQKELRKPFSSESFAGQIEPLTISILPLRDMGLATMKVSDLKGSSGTISASDIEMGYVSNRLSRVTMEGSIYTITPRIIMPGNNIPMQKQVARRIWLTIKTPKDAKPGLYQGSLTLVSEDGQSTLIPIELKVHNGGLDPVDVPAGPFGYTINTPWVDNDKEASTFNQTMAVKSLTKMREYGFTMFSGMPTIYYKGFNNGRPELDFTTADLEMKLAKDLGFLAVSSYGSNLKGLDSYYEDTEQMKKAGFTDYSTFINTIYIAIQKHANEQNWIPIYWNLADEPLGDDLQRSIKNATAYKNAFPKGPPYFSGATSFTGNNPEDPHFKLSKEFHVANLGLHDETGINSLHQEGIDWAFYNNGNRWTYGEYLYKANKQFGMKFRLAWHWNISAGDPFYALDCREDDYAWCHGTIYTDLMPEVSFERIAAGLVDYQMLLTLQRLAKEKAGTAAAIEAEKFIAGRLAAFKLGQTDHDALYPIEDWTVFRHKMADLIEALRK